MKKYKVIKRGFVPPVKEAPLKKSSIIAGNEKQNFEARSSLASQMVSDELLRLKWFGK